MAAEKKNQKNSVVKQTDPEQREKALSAALAQIEKQFGKGSIMKLGQTQSLDIEAVSTGSIGLDMALGIGGLPMGRIVEIFGPESSGKTTLTLSAIAQAQKAGKTCAFIDAEHALDPIYARNTFTIHNIEIHFAEWWSNFVFHHFHTGFTTDNIITIFYYACTTNI